MKLVVIVTLWVAATIGAMAQSVNGCSTLEGMAPTSDFNSRKLFDPVSPKNNGWMMPSHRYIKAVVIFTEFPDDGFYPDTAGPNAHPEWPKGRPPIWVQNPRLLFEPTYRYSETVFDPLPNSVSDYFWQMSRQDFDTGLRVYADCFYVPYHRTREEVLRDSIRQDLAIVEVIRQLDEEYGGQGIDFGQYDRWTTTGPWTSTYGPDGVVDLIIVVWRNVARDIDWRRDTVWSANKTIFLDSLRWSVVSRFGIGLGKNQDWQVDPLQDLELVDGGLHQIYVRGFPFQRRASNGIEAYLRTGGNIAMINFAQKDPMRRRATGILDDQFRVLIHEIGHVLSGDHRESGSWSVLSVTDSRGYGMSGRELIEHGWARPTVIRKGDTARRITLGDLYTTGECVAIELERTTPDWPWDNGPKWYILENHQHLSPYDYTSSFDSIRDQTHGLYVHYVESHKNDQHIQSADGVFLWDSRYEFNPPWGGTIPAFERLRQVRSGGASRSEVIPLDTVYWKQRNIRKKTFPMYGEVIDGVPRLREHWLGQLPGDHHSATRKAVWSPWSSPGSTYTEHGLRTATSLYKPVESGASFHILSESNGVFTLDVCADSTPIGPPDVPINVVVPSVVGVAPDDPEPILYGARLHWSPNREPDLAGYIVLRKPGVTTNGWEAIADVAATDTVFHDTVALYPFDALPANVALRRVQYAVEAEDKDGNVSERSPVFTATIDYLSGPPGVPDYVDSIGVNEVVLTMNRAGVHPNPAGSWIRIVPETDRAYNGPATLLIHDGEGRLMDRHDFSWGAGRQTVTKNIAEYRPGMYVATLQRGADVQSVRFVKGE